MSRTSVLADADAQASRSEGSESFFSVAALLCLGAIMLDGLDTALVGIAGPAIIRGYDVPASSLTAAFVATNIGAALGYIVSGPLSRRWNERLVLILSVALFGALTLATPAAPSIYWLAGFRLVTAIALGCALPAAICFVVARVADDKVGPTTIFVASGLALGGVLGGLSGSAILLRYGWQSLFYLGGVLPIVISAALAAWLPSRSKESPAAIGEIAPPIAGGGLLAREVRVRSICLWAFSFLIFAEAYALLFWIPILLTGYGHAAGNASFGVAVFSVGGLIANVVLVFLVRTLPVSRVLLGYVGLALASVVCLSFAGSVLWTALFAIAASGAALIGCSVGQSALATLLYPHPVRATGIGVAAAFGRVGSTVGPAAIGSLLALGWSGDRILLVSAAPLVLAFVALVVFEAARPNRAGLREGTPTPANRTTTY